MERLYLEIPSSNRKEEAIEYIREHQEYNSSIHGCGSLDDYVDNYEEWLVRLESFRSEKPPKGYVPSETYFLIREMDNKIIGMIDIRLRLNERLMKYGAHIGYGIRPIERRKGYNKINLYLGLKVCREHNMEEVLLDADLNNPASWKTMEALGGTKIGEYIDEEDNERVVRYSIPVEKSLEEYKEIYEPKIKVHVR